MRLYAARIIRPLVLRRMHSILTPLLLAVSSACGTATSTDLRVAVATNFGETMTTIAAQFQEQTGKKIALSFGSTGSQYAQIRNGAPFDLFFAADVHRPMLLEQDGLGVTGSRFTYALGRLVLWSPDPSLVDPQGRILADGAFRFLALANPELAPYGRAARDVLRSMGLWDDLSKRIVQGENIGQTFQFVRTGNAAMGFVAYSQVMRDGKPFAGSMWIVPDSLYLPIEQQAVILTDNEATRRFVAFVKSENGRRIIHEFGYETP